jgi:nitrogen fixation protein NifU and related proteins
MTDKPQSAITPEALGEMPDADAIGTAGNAACGDMVRMWIKFKEEQGKKVIDRATFQSFGCETAIAVAAQAIELIRGKTAEEALTLSPTELSGEIGPLPPIKIHCAQLVESALHSALDPAPAGESLKAAEAPPPGSNLLDRFTGPKKDGGVRVVFFESPDSTEKE